MILNLFFIILSLFLMILSLFQLIFNSSQLFVSFSVFFLIKDSLLDFMKNSVFKSLILFKQYHISLFKFNDICIFMIKLLFIVNTLMFEEMKILIKYLTFIIFHNFLINIIISLLSFNKIISYSLHNFGKSKYKIFF